MKCCIRSEETSRFRAGVCRARSCSHSSSRAPQAPAASALLSVWCRASGTLGTYLLLLVRFGSRRAALTTVMVHALNFYSMQKSRIITTTSPAVTETTLGISGDFAIVWDVVPKRRNVSRRLVPGRTAGARVWAKAGSRPWLFADLGCVRASIWLWFLYRGSRPDLLVGAQPLWPRGDVSYSVIAAKSFWFRC